MTAYQHAQQLGLTGTDDEIVAILRTLTARDIPVSHVTAWMRERRLWLLLPGGQEGGSLYGLWRDTDNPDIKAGLGEWYASCFGRGAENVLGTRPDIAVQIAQITGLVAAVIPDGPAIVAELYAMMGGRPYAESTVEEYAEQRADAEAKAARETAYSAVVNRLNYVRALTVAAKDSGAIPEEIQQAAVATWDNWPPEPADDEESESIDDTEGAR